MKPSKPGIYKSERDLELISHVTDVITCENYCKWYSLYYIQSDGTVSILSDLYDTFFDEIEFRDHSFEPKSVVKFALKHGLNIGLDAYKAICYMYAEYCEYEDRIPKEHLPTSAELSYVLLEDYGNWSKCFPYPVPFTGFKLASDSEDRRNPINTTEKVLEYDGITVVRINDFMYAVFSSFAECCKGYVYMIDHLYQIGEAIGAFIHKHFDEGVIEEEYDRTDNIMKEIDTVDEDNIVAFIEKKDQFDNVTKSDVLKYFIPSFIDVYRSNGKMVEGAIVTFPLRVCRGQIDALNNRGIPTDIYDDAIKEFNKFGDRRYLTISDPSSFASHDVVRYTTANIAETVGIIIGISVDRIYVKITNAELLNTILQPDNLYKMSVDMRYIGRSSYDTETESFRVTGDMRIICFDMVNRTAGNQRYYFNLRYK